MSEARARELIAAIYARDSSGCCLHVVIDDGNVDAECVAHCSAFAAENRCSECVELSGLLASMTAPERMRVVGQADALRQFFSAEDASGAALKATQLETLSKEKEMYHELKERHDLATIIVDAAGTADELAKAICALATAMASEAGVVAVKLMEAANLERIRSACINKLAVTMPRQSLERMAEFVTTGPYRDYQAAAKRLGGEIAEEIAREAGLR